MLCKSIKMHVLLSIAFGIAELFPLLATGIPANETCVKAISDIACYLQGSEKLVDWNTAKQACDSSHSTLPVIRNKNDQDALAGYLKSQTKNVSAWTAGKRFKYTGWTWVSEEKLNEDVRVQLLEGEPSPSGLEEDHVALCYTGTDFKFIGLHASQELPYICQGIDARCKPSIKVNMHSECISMFNDNRTWYDARNQCLMADLNLAVINDDVHGYLKERLKLNQSYWIGLRKKSWRWTLNDGGGPDDEVKYTNWDNNVYSTEGECIFVDGSDGNWKWKTSGCTEQTAAAVCQRGQDVTSPATTAKASVEIVFAAVGAGIVIIICVIVIIFVALSTKNNRETRQSRLKYSSLRNNREEIDNNMSNAAVYASVSKRVNAPVNISDDICGVYAEVKMSTLNHSEGETTNQQPGILYASLDFKEGSTNQEPDQKPDLATALTKVDPFGDSYALPEAKCHEATFPFKESDSQSVKGEGEVFYANLKTETLKKEHVSEDHDQPS